MGTRSLTSFECVFELIWVITSRVLTQILSGGVSLIRHAERLRLSGRHGLCVVTAFMLLIGNRANFWRSHSQPSRSALGGLIDLIFVSILCGICDLVMPEKPAEYEVLNLGDHHVRQGEAYKFLQVMFAALALVAIAYGTPDFEQWLKASGYALIAVLIGGIALRARSVWLETATAAGSVMLGAVYMAARLRLLPA